jgi:hypothetical protein
MSCTGPAPTFADIGDWVLSHDGSGCENTATIHVNAECGSSGYTVKLIRTIDGSDTTVYTASIPNGPLTAMAFSYEDLPPCGHKTIEYRWEIQCDGVLQSTSYNMSTDQGGGQTLTGHTINVSSCEATDQIRVQQNCGNCAATLKLYRSAINSSVTFDPGEVIYTVSVGAGVTDQTYSYGDTPTCGYGQYHYQWRLTPSDDAAITSDEQTYDQETAPTVDGFTLTPAGCDNVASVHVLQPCGRCGAILKLYRHFNGSVAFSPDEVIHTEDVPQGFSDATYSYTDTPSCGKGTWHYAWKLEWDNGSTGVAELTADGALPATLVDHEIAKDAECNITNKIKVTNPCLACAGTIKLYRKLNSAPAGVPGELIYTDAVPAGLIVHKQYIYTEHPGDGHWYYEWSVVDVDGNVDDTLPPKDITVDCTVYVPARVTLPSDAFEKQVVLVQVTGSPAGGLIFTDKQILNLAEQRLEWWYHKNGGCAYFRILTHEFLDGADFTDAMDESWEVHVRIKLGGEDTYTTWYRGVIRSIKQQEQGTDLYMDVRGYGYVEMLNNIMVQREYPVGMTVKEIVDDIIDKDVRPWTRIVRPSDIDVTNGDSGVDPSGYAIKDRVHFECSALTAIKFLAELQGDREWGVDALRRFYFRANNSDVVANFFLLKDVIDRVAGGKILGQTNSYKMAGKSFGARDYLKVRADVTDATAVGRREKAVELPWLEGDLDASRWADNIIGINRGGQQWAVITKKHVTQRLDASHPFGRVTVYGSDMSNDVHTYDIAKIQYIEGGPRAPAEVREKGVPKKTADNDQPLKVQYYLGHYPNDLIDELKETLRDQIEALKGRHKQFRYPNDITNEAILIPGKIPGEMKFYHKVPDVTNTDVLNSAIDLSDPTNPRGSQVVWIGGQWVKVSVRRTFTSLSGVRGLYIGEVASVITDITNSSFGVMYWWNGLVWDVVGSGSGGGGGGGSSVGSDPPTTILPDDAPNPGVSALASRQDHRHGIAADVAGPIAIGDSAAEGVATSFARSDHRHSVPAGTPVDITNANADGVATTFARSDHRHRGIRTVKVKGQADIDGYVDITAGLYIRVTQSGQTLTFDVDDLVAYINTLALAAYNPITDPVFWSLMG